MQIKQNVLGLPFSYSSVEFSVFKSSGDICRYNGVYVQLQINIMLLNNEIKGAIKGDLVKTFWWLLFKGESKRQTSIQAIC